MSGEGTAEKRIRRAVEMAEAATHKVGLEEIYLPRFHRAMDDLQPGEGEEVYHRLRRRGWYLMAVEALKHEAARLGGAEPETSR